MAFQIPLLIWPPAAQCIIGVLIWPLHQGKETSPYFLWLFRLQDLFTFSKLSWPFQEFTKFTKASWSGSNLSLLSSLPLIYTHLLQLPPAHPVSYGDASLPYTAFPPPALSGSPLRDRQQKSMSLHGHINGRIPLSHELSSIHHPIILRPPATPCYRLFYLIGLY